MYCVHIYTKSCSNHSKNNELVKNVDLTPLHIQNINPSVDPSTTHTSLSYNQKLKSTLVTIDSVSQINDVVLCHNYSR
jgi:uncharacterized FlaG/YvyC family protein